jgi:hypothetical protein
MSEHSRQKTNALEDSEMSEAVRQERRLTVEGIRFEWYPGRRFRVMSKERNIPKVHTEENSLVLVRVYAAGDEGDRE